MIYPYNIYELAGRLAQVANDAAQKELEKICDKSQFDAAYFGFRITLELCLLEEQFTKRMQTVLVNETQNWNWPDENTKTQKE